MGKAGALGDFADLHVLGHHAPLPVQVRPDSTGCPPGSPMSRLTIAHGRRARAFAARRFPRRRRARSHSPDSDVAVRLRADCAGAVEFCSVPVLLDRREGAPVYLDHCRVPPSHPGVSVPTPVDQPEQRRPRIPRRSPAQRRQARTEQVTSVIGALRSPRRLRTEVLAGLVVALALIPEALSFSIIAGDRKSTRLNSSHVATLY